MHILIVHLLLGDPGSKQSPQLHVSCHKELQNAILPGDRTGGNLIWAAKDP